MCGFMLMVRGAYAFNEPWKCEAFFAYGSSMPAHYAAKHFIRCGNEVMLIFVSEDGKWFDESIRL